MSQETERYQLENNGNSYLVRTPASGGGGTEVEANPEGTATEDLTKLKVDDTIYAVPTPHTINTYTPGTLSADDQAKIAIDIANGYPIHVGQGIYIYWGGANEVYFVKFNSTPVNNDFSINIVSYNKTSHQLNLYTNKSNIPINIQGLNYSDISGALLTKLSLGGQDRVFGAVSTYAQTTAPTANNTDGGIRLVVLTSEPATYYNGYYYIIAPTP